MSTSLVQEKVTQAIGLLRENNIDMWLTFVRETSGGGDPVLPLIYGLDLTWQSALILAASGETIAIVGRLEAEAARRTGAYESILYYDQSIQHELLLVLERLNPTRIAINYSVDDVHADGLTFGMYQLLCKYLESTPFINRLESAEKLHSGLRGRKTPQEIECIKMAIRTTYEIFQNTFDYIKIGLSETDISDFMHAQLDKYRVQPAWEPIN
jgi:Xaa-Pro aminopeptidase